MNEDNDTNIINNQEDKRQLEKEGEDNSNKYSFPEYSDEEIRLSFECFDISNGGTISFEELKFIYKSLEEEVSNEVIEEMIKLGSRNNIGQVDYKSFYYMINN